MKQKEIWNIHFDSVIGREQAENRPAVIISGNTLNKNLDIVWVCPLSSSVHNYQGHPILEPNEDNGLKKESEVMVFHIRAVSKKRFKNRIGKISREEMNQITSTINDILDL